MGSPGSEVSAVTVNTIVLLLSSSDVIKAWNDTSSSSSMCIDSKLDEDDSGVRIGLKKVLSLLNSHPAHSEMVGVVVVVIG